MKKSLIILILFLNFPAFSSDFTFKDAFASALKRSFEVKKNNFILDSKKKLLLNSYSNKDWTANFTSTFTFDNKKVDNIGDFQEQNSNLNSIVVNKKIFDFGVTENANDIAKNNLKISKNELMIIKQNLFIEVLSSYLDVYNSNKIINLRKSSVKRFKKLVDASKLKLSAGTITPTTVSEAIARLARSEYELALSRSEEINFKNKFKSLVGLDVELSRLRLPSFEHGLPKSIVLALESSISKSLKLINISLEKQNAILSKKKQVLNNYPSLDFKFNLKSNESNVDSSTSDYSSYGSVFTFTTPLFTNNSEKQFILSLEDNINSLLEQEKETKRLVKLNTVSLYNNIKNSKINVNAAYKEYNAAKLALNGIKKEEEFGLRTLLDVLDSEVDVMDAEVKVLKSKSDQVLSKYKLLIDIGKFKI